MSPLEPAFIECRSTTPGSMTWESAAVESSQTTLNVDLSGVFVRVGLAFHWFRD
jgi:hypothetical protein